MRRLLALLTSLVLVVTGSGCATWGNATARPEAALATGPTTVRVRSTGGPAILLLQDPAIEGDSLVGWVRTDGRLVRSATAMADIARLDVPVPAWAPAGAAGALLGTFAFMVGAGALQAIVASGT